MTCACAVRRRLMSALEIRRNDHRGARIAALDSMLCTSSRLPTRLDNVEVAGVPDRHPRTRDSRSCATRRAPRSADGAPRFESRSRTGAAESPGSPIIMPSVNRSRRIWTNSFQSIGKREIGVEERAGTGNGERGTGNGGSTVRASVPAFPRRGSGRCFRSRFPVPSSRVSRSASPLPHPSFAAR